jgi:hypothetical protein
MPRSPVSPDAESPATAVTSPSVDENENEDIWGDGEDVLSDLPLRKRQQMTDGYREGLSIGKARVMQNGFDQGYPIGVQIGLRVGPIMGVLEAYLASKSTDAVLGMREMVKTTYATAVEALSIAELLKNSNEEKLMEATTIPASALATIEYWEAKGVYLWII